MGKCYDLPRVTITVKGGMATYETEGDVLVHLIYPDSSEGETNEDYGKKLLEMIADLKDLLC